MTDAFARIRRCRSTVRWAGSAALAGMIVSLATLFATSGVLPWTRFASAVLVVAAGAFFLGGLTFLVALEELRAARRRVPAVFE